MVGFGVLVRRGSGDGGLGGGLVSGVLISEVVCILDGSTGEIGSGTSNCLSVVVVK